MSVLNRALAPFALLLMLAVAAPAQAQNYSDMNPEDIEANIAGEHPAVFYVLASKLFDRGERDEAVFWFYAGQLRYRTHLACNPDLPPDGDPALFGALSDVIGGEINRYAFGDLDTLTATLDRVIAWDSATDNRFTPKERCVAQHTEVLTGLTNLRSYIVENAEEVRTERTANGLENR